MAAFDTTRPMSHVTTGRITHFVTKTLGAVATWNDTRITRNSLSKLTARELDDIGLTHADVQAMSKR